MNRCLPRIYIYIYMYIYKYTYTYIYIYIERERERERCKAIYISTYTYTYIYIHTYIHTYVHTIHTKWPPPGKEVLLHGRDAAQDDLRAAAVRRPGALDMVYDTYNQNTTTLSHDKGYDNNIIDTSLTA